ncbi:MAG: SbcC/MukB-like Walker B domain-containing protein, partial [Planctomycetota bacterium]
LQALQAAADQADAAHRQAMQRRANLQSRQEQLAQARKRLAELEREGGKLQQRYLVLGHLAEVACDRNNAERIDFKTWVLQALLDDVLAAATQRLRTMSKGRFFLQRQREAGSGRSASGLELEVFDTYTGTERPVQTLSGGEGFLASLSLALGLADVVQNYAGGIRLETIFVDEGFGSLDAESLDLALRSLIDLQAGGRLVGIISHVSELAERIDARLEVAGHRRGSTAQFVVG